MKAKEYRIIKCTEIDSRGNTVQSYYEIEYKRRAWYGLMTWNRVKHKVGTWADTIMVTTKWPNSELANAYIKDVLCKEMFKPEWKEEIVSVVKCDE